MAIRGITAAQAPNLTVFSENTCVRQKGSFHLWDSGSILCTTQAYKFHLRLTHYFVVGLTTLFVTAPIMWHRSLLQHLWLLSQFSPHNSNLCKSAQSVCRYRILSNVNSTVKSLVPYLQGNRNLCWSGNRKNWRVCWGRRSMGFFSWPR